MQLLLAQQSPSKLGWQLSTSVHSTVPLQKTQENLNSAAMINPTNKSFLVGLHDICLKFSDIYGVMQVLETKKPNLHWVLVAWEAVYLS